jgi:hypothetical protein
MRISCVSLAYLSISLPFSWLKGLTGQLHNLLHSLGCGFFGFELRVACRF